MDINDFTPHEDHDIVSLEILFSVKRIEKDVYQSLHGGISLGGHVFGQAVYVAAQTIPKHFLLHNVNGHWLVPVRKDVPLIFKVNRLSDGRNYCSRRIEAFQDSNRATFHCTCSFKIPEPDAFDAQRRLNIHEIYKSVLQGQRPEDFPESREDWISFANSAKRTKIIVPGMKATRVPMNDYNTDRSPEDRRALYFYTGVGPTPSTEANPHIHICQLLYSCDRESASTPAIHFQLADELSSVASLSMTVIVHAGIESLAVYNRAQKDRWFAQEVWTDRAADGRAMHHSKIYDESGTHVASVMQDCLLRLRGGPSKRPAYMHSQALKERL